MRLIETGNGLCETCEFYVYNTSRKYIGEVAGGGPVDDVDDESNWSTTENSRCHRYPKRIKVYASHWCGEHKPKMEGGE